MLRPATPKSPPNRSLRDRFQRDTGLQKPISTRIHQSLQRIAPRRLRRPICFHNPNTSLRLSTVSLVAETHGNPPTRPQSCSIWRPRRDSNPCYRRESGKPNRNRKELQEHGRTGWRSKSSKKCVNVSPLCPRKVGDSRLERLSRLCNWRREWDTTPEVVSFAHNNAKIHRYQYQSHTSCHHISNKPILPDQAPPFFFRDGQTVPGGSSAIRKLSQEAFTHIGTVLPPQSSSLDSFRPWHSPQCLRILLLRHGGAGGQ